MTRYNTRSLHCFSRRFHVLCVVVIGLLSIPILADANTPDEQAAKIDTMEPTVFLIERDGRLLQRIDATLTVPKAAITSGVKLRATFGSEDLGVVLDEIAEGTKTYDLYVPEVIQPTEATFSLLVGGERAQEHVVRLTPQRHWEVYLTPISHHDLGYTQSAEAVLHQYLGIYDKVLDLCEKTAAWPEGSRFKYTVEQAWSVQHYVENRPKDVIDRFARYVREGRIEITALFGDEVSCMCSHEELIRLMYPSFRFKREFDGEIRTAFINDVPGLSWGLPTVLADAGVKYFFAGLPTYFEWGDWGKKKITSFWDESKVLRHGRPDAFRWAGPDGGSVLVYYQGGYGCWNRGSLHEAEKDLARMLRDMEKSGCPFSVARYGCAGCDDNTSPALWPSEVAKQWNAKWAYPKYKVATITEFFEALEPQCEDVRVFRGELPHTDYNVGATSSAKATAVKSAKATAVNRLTHDKLNAAEKLNTISSLLGDPSHADTIGSAYRSMMLYDEHTWGMARPAGELQDWCWSDKSHHAYRAAGIAYGILSVSVERLTRHVNLDEPGYHIVVHNALSIPRSDVVRMSRFSIDGPFDLIDSSTKESIPYQIVKLDSPQAPVPYAADRYAIGKDRRTPYELIDLVFIARDETGGIVSIYDKQLSREMVDNEAAHRLNQLVVRHVENGDFETSKAASIRKQETGPVFGSLRVITQAPGCPQIVQDIVLYDSIKRIDLANRVLKDSTPLLECYFAFPFKVEPPDFRFEGSNSVIEPFRDQFPGSNSNYYSVQHWAHVSDGKIGVTLAPIESHLIEFGGIWPSYVSQAHHAVDLPEFGHRGYVQPNEVKHGYMYAYVLNSNFRTNFRATQQDDLLFRYSITTHTGDWTSGQPRNLGWSVSNPLIPAGVFYRQKGTLDKAASFCQVDQENVLVSTIKNAEDGRGVIIRLIETLGQDVTAKLSLPRVTIGTAYRTNIVEENIDELSAQPHEIEVPVKAFGIATIRLIARASK